MTMNQSFRMVQMPQRSLWCIGCFVALGGCVHDADKDRFTDIRLDHCYFPAEGCLLNADGWKLKLLLGLWQQSLSENSQKNTISCRSLL